MMMIVSLAKLQSFRKHLHIPLPLLPTCPRDAPPRALFITIVSPLFFLLCFCVGFVRPVWRLGGVCVPRGRLSRVAVLRPRAVRGWPGRGRGWRVRVF